MTHEFQVRYVTVTCDLCNETRFAEEPSCGCEEQVGVADDHVRRRRRLIWHAGPVDSGHPEKRPVQSEPDGALFGRCSDLLDGLLTSFQLIAADRPDAARQLRTVLMNFRDLRSEVQLSSHLRPWLGFWQAIERTLEDIEDVASSYIGALICDTAREAEKLASDAQSALDRAAATIASYSDLLDHWSQIDDSAMDPLDILPSIASATSAIHESMDIVDMDTSGSALFRRVTGHEPPDPGFGIGMLVTDFVASVIYDRESLWSRAEAAYQILASDRQQLVSLLGKDAWLHDYTSSVAELRDAATESAALSAAATNERIEVRATIRLGARLFEPIARPLLVPLLAIGKGRSVERLTNKDPNVSVNQMRQAGLNRLVEGLLVGLRDADAHNKYSLDGDKVLLTSNRSEQSEMTRAKLLDTVLTGMETLHSLHLAMSSALLTAGVPVEDLPDADAWSFSESQKVSLALGASGWTNVRVSRIGSTVEATGTGLFPTNPMSLGGACLPALSDDVATLVLRSTGDEAHELKMDVRAFRDRKRLQDSWDREVAFIYGCVRSSYDSRPIFSRDQVRKWIAMKAGEVLKDRSDRERLHRLARLASNLGDNDMSESVRAAERIQAARLVGGRVSRDDIESLDLLIEWERRRL